jgi:photosystem II stability/assembly factor-like uncharacterized protein
VTFTVNDSKGGSDSEAVTITVRNMDPPSPDIRISPPSIDFGTVKVGESADRVFEIYNDGHALLEISSITSTDPQFAALSYSNVEPSASLSVTARFTPSSEGSKLGQLVIASNDPDEPVVSMAVEGKATQTPDIHASPSSIDFGEVVVGQSSDKILHIHNYGDTVLQIHDIIPNDSQFAVSSYSNVDPLSEIAVVVKFTPSSPGPKTAELTVVSNDPDEPTVSVPLEGKGIETLVPDIRVSTSSIDFGNVEVGGSLDKEFQIHNDGNATLQISSITSSNSQFVVLTDPDVEPGGVAAIPVRFVPSSSGSKTAVITIASNDPDESSKSVSVQGKGIQTLVPDIRVSTSSIDFGNVEVGGSLDKEFQIHNDGNVTLQISSITSDNSRFVILDDPDVAPGDVVDITVRFTPSSLGTDTGTITIISNDPDDPTVSIAVEGKGVEGADPDIHVSPHVIEFGEVELGESSDRSFYIYNLGDSLLRIYSLTSSDDQFEILDDPDVDPDDTIEIPVRFTPSSLGSKSGIITIASNDPDESSVPVWVYGEGIYPEFPAAGDWQLTRQQNLLTDLSDVHFVDEDDGWVVGSSGTVAHSSDGGDTWTPQSSGTSRTLKGVYFINSNTGWAVGQYGTILRTANGGSSWSSQSGSVSLDLNAVEFVSSSRGWIVGNAGIVLTTNNGYTWTYQESGIQFNLNDVCFVSSYRGWAVGNHGTILRTSDGGQTWTSQYSGTNATLHGVDFVDHYEGWVVGSSGTILHTEDGGQTWVSQNSGVSYSALVDVDFLTSSEGWAVGYGGMTLHTDDGGSTWVRVDSGVDEALRSVQFRDVDNGWAVGSYGTILRYYTEEPLVIMSVTVSGSPANVGDVIRVTATGQAGTEARFSISGVVSNVEMTEYPAGTYTGSYTVTEGVNVTGALVIVALANQYGDITTDTSQTVTIDTVATINWANVSPKVATTGDTVTVAMGGEPDGTARFSIETITANVTMTEDPDMPGSYTGYYTVPQGTNANDVRVTVKLTDELGNVTEKEAGQITIDTTAQITSVSVDGSPAGFGKPIIVILIGESGGSAKFSISDLVSDAAMIENQPGVYTGNYTAPKGTYLKDGTVTVQLTDALGNTTSMDAGKVTIDTESRIDSVSVPGNPARAGEAISVTMVGESNGTAQFAIAGIIDSVPMKEAVYQRGTYTGTYIVADDDISVTDAVLTVTLTDALGNVGTDASQRVTIDTTMPEINSVSVSGSPARAGGAITVRMVGEPDASSQFSVAGVIENVPMQVTADQPGTYTGTHTVADNTNVTDAVVTVMLTDAVGNVSTDISQRVTIDTIAPEITSVNVSGSPAKVGETISVIMVGESHASAQFSIAGMVGNASMEEDGDQPGTYRGTYAVADGVSVTDAVLTVTLTDAVGNTRSDGSRTVTICPAWDVNRDCIMDASDLVIIGTYFGEAATEESDADVNGDGYVNIADLILVCKHFGGSTANASPGRGVRFNAPTEVDPGQLPILRKLYSILDTSSIESPDLVAAKKLLAELIGLPAVEIAESRLMQNYPNPCNPETWIPYDLAEPGDVTINIYSSSGRLVRTLDLGYRRAGSYSDRDRAVYWDGANESGEKVSSGIYFYAIRSGKFSAVRKMIISR